MMEYRFTVTTIPDTKSGYHLPAYTEGSLEVVLDGQIFVRVDEALLVEFAIVLSKWLRSQPNDLHYASMDFEEEPVFALKKRDGVFDPSSVWATGKPVAIQAEDAIAAAHHYVEELGAALARHGVDLSIVIDEAVSADA